MPRHLDTSTENTNGQNHGPVWKTPLFLLNEICTVILWQDNNEKGNSKKALLEHMAGRKVPNCECFFVNPGKRTTPVPVYADDIKLAGQETEHQSDLENYHERRRFGRTNILSGPCLSGLHSKRMPD